MKTAKSLFGIFVFWALLAVQLPGQSFLTNGLVSYYPFSGNANDVVGTNNGTVYGAVLSTNRFGQTNSAYLFDGSSSYIDLGQPNNLAFTNNFTLSAWCLFNGGSDSPRIICYSEGIGYDFYTAGTSSCRSLGCYLGNEGFQTGQCFSQNNWYSVAMVVSNGNSTIYVDGVDEGSGPINTPDFEAPRLYIGRSTSADYWGGLISNVRFYNRALSSNEVAQLYAFESTSNPLTITQDLTNSYAVYGQNASLSVSASDTSPIRYQWYFNPITNSGQAVAYAETISGFVYGIVVTNGGFGYGNVPNVSFVGGGGGGAAAYATISNGIVAGITVTNAGHGYTSPPTVVIDPPNGLLYGQTNSILTISNASVSNLGSYYVVLSDNAGNTVTSSVVSLTLVYPPGITNNPVGFSTPLGGSGSMSVSATGTPPFNYQWMLNGTNINDATNSIYTITSLDLTNTGSYVVEVTNPYGYMYSSPVNVFMMPSLDSPFTGAVVIWGQAADLNVGAIGSGTLNYQWYFNGQPISGADSGSYDISSIQFTNAGLYSVVVSSPYGSVTNKAYQVVVNPSNVSLALRPDLIIQGTVGYSYIIESSSDLSNPNAWVVQTNITLSTPTYEWIDYSVDAGKNPHKFYQVLPGQ